MPLVAGGLGGAPPWPLSGPCPVSLMNKLCGPCVVHTQSKGHMTWGAVPWNWHWGPRSSSWSSLISSVTLDESPSLSEPRFLDLKPIPVSQCCGKWNELTWERVHCTVLIQTLNARVEQNQQSTVIKDQQQEVWNVALRKVCGNERDFPHLRGYICGTLHTSPVCKFHRVSIT